MESRTAERIAYLAEHHELVMHRIRLGGFLGVSVSIGLGVLPLI